MRESWFKPGLLVKEVVPDCIAGYALGLAVYARRGGQSFNAQANSNFPERSGPSGVAPEPVYKPLSC